MAHEQCRGRTLERCVCYVYVTDGMYAMGTLRDGVRVGSSGVARRWAMGLTGTEDGIELRH